MRDTKEDLAVASENIRRTRAKKGATRLAVAIRAGCDPSTVYDVERNHGNLESRVRIGRALGLGPARLFRKGRR